jgi:hypothetical protein
MKNAKPNKLNQLNMVLSSGLCVLSAKRREGSSIAVLYITDYNNNTRVVFDIEEKKVISNRDNIDFTKEDVEAVSKVLMITEKK